MEEYAWCDLGDTRYAVIEKKRIDEFMLRCERENWEVYEESLGDESVENIEDCFKVRIEKKYFIIGNEHLSDSENQRTDDRMMAKEERIPDRMMNLSKEERIDDIQHAIINCIAVTIEGEIRIMMEKTSLVAIIFDETTDLRMTSQMLRVLRFIEKKKPQETFLGYVDVLDGVTEQPEKRSRHEEPEALRTLFHNTLDEIIVYVEQKI
ncbi:Hypothetical predicted protein [Octopus vulgaris]|uniref:DUF4371 domain-containing protein n=1 Tax=Octopus vulgaris TaxID=6645 RepID=A0AA36F6R6_OCTVU|nr:Hypothetical predicted protein [Octopus vulgaris]